MKTVYLSGLYIFFYERTEGKICSDIWSSHGDEGVVGL